MDKVQEVKAAISAFQGDTQTMKLRQRWQEDYDLFRMKPYNAGKGYYSYTSNAPRIIADKAVSMLVDAKLLIRIPEDILTAEEINTASNVERYLYGAQNMNDEANLHIPDKLTNRQLKAWYAVLRGSFAERIWVHKGEGNKTLPEVTIWDMYNVCYGKDSKGVSWAAYTYKIPAKQAKEEYGVQESGAEIEIVDFYDRKKNLFIVSDKEVRHQEHDLGYCPIFIFRVGATPVVWQSNYQYTEKHSGESIYAPVRELIPILNKTLSDLMTLVRRGVKVPMGYWSAEGNKTIEEDIYQVEKAAVVPLRIGEVFLPLLPQTMPPDAKDLLNIITGELQRGSFSHTNFGELGFRLSGYAISQLQSALETVITPFVTALEQSYLIECLELVKQYAGKDLPPVEVRGRTSRNQPFGYPVAMKVKPADIKGDWHPEVRLEPILPKDAPQRYELARLAREGEIPLLSDETIRSEILQIQDPRLEESKIDREWADKQIINRLYDAYMSYVEVGDVDKAKNVLMALRFAMMQTGQRGGGAPAQKTPTEREAAATSGAGLPARTTGIPAETMPPEQMGGLPPGALNARMPAMAEEM